MRLDRSAADRRKIRALKTPDDRPVHRLALWRRVAVWPLVVLIRIWAGTLRIVLTEESKRLVRSTRPTVFVLWHNRLFIAAELKRRFRVGHPMCGLISASRDGGWLAAFYASWGVKPVRGSSSRLGRQAATGLIDELRMGSDAGITPDGPRGPVYEMKPGALTVARRSGARLCLLGLDYESSWRLRSWDGFHLPRPFSRATLHLEEVATEKGDDLEAEARRLGARLKDLNPDRKPAPVRRRA